MTSIVYPFYQTKAQGDELKYSIRSVCKYAKFDNEVVIIGDRPSWFNGRVIEMNNNRVARKFTRTYDLTAKRRKILKTNSITDDFLFMYDDQYFLNDVSVDDFSKPIAMKEIKSRKTPVYGSETWRELLRRTIEALHENGHDMIYNYETHLPRLINKKRMEMILNVYDIPNQPLMFNTLYFNEFYSEPVIELEVENPIKAGIYKPMGIRDIQRLAEGKIVMNNGDAGWNHNLSIFLKNKFPEKCKYEK